MSVSIYIWGPYLIGVAIGAWSHHHYIKRRDMEEGNQ
jgi:hypothetical protein